MQVLAVSTNHGDPRPYLAEEAAGTDELRRGGLLSDLWVKADWSGAVMVLECPDLPAARAAVSHLPLVRHGVTSFTFIEIVRPPTQP